MLSFMGALNPVILGKLLAGIRLARVVVENSDREPIMNPTKLILGLAVLFVGAAAYAGGGGGGGGGGGAEPSALALLTMGAATWWAARKR